MANITIYQPDRSEKVHAPSPPPPKKKNSAGSKLSQNSLSNFDVA